MELATQVKIVRYNISYAASEQRLLLLLHFFGFVCVLTFILVFPVDVQESINGLLVHAFDECLQCLEYVALVDREVRLVVLLSQILFHHGAHLL